MITWLRYVPHGQLLRFLARGWVLSDELHGASHGEHAVLMCASDAAWLPVVGWDGVYEVSVSGGVRSLDRMMVSETAKFGYPRRMKGRVLSPHMNKDSGYLSVVLHAPDGRNLRRYVAHIVAEAWLGPRPEGMYVCHGDGNKTNNSANNLRYDTPLANEADKLAHGTRVRGEQLAHAKLNEEYVRCIRRLSVTTDHKLIAKRFGVSTNLVDCVVHRRVWGHLHTADGEVGSPDADRLRAASIRDWRSKRMAAVNSGMAAPVLRGWTFDGEPV